MLTGLGVVGLLTGGLVGGRTNRVARGVTDSPDNLTTDPPRPPGTPDVDDLVGDPVPTGEQRAEPDNEDVADDTASVEPPD